MADSDDATNEDERGETSGRDGAEGGDRESRLLMSADDALALLAAGKPLVNLRIIGLKLTGEFDKQIEIRNCWLTRLNMCDVVFKKRISFYSCHLHRARIGRDATFEAGLSFQGSTLRTCQFEKITVRGGLFRIDNVQTLSSTKFLSCNFESKVKAWEARFAGWANFIHCQFGDDVDMRSVNASEGIVFEDCDFAGEMLFRGASVAKKLDFGNSRMKGLLDLSKAKLHDFVYLEAIDAGPNCRFAVRNAVTNRLLINPAQLTGRLLSEIEKDYVASMHEYGLLKRNYEAQHRHDDEDWAFYRFKINQRRSKATTWKNPWQKIKAGAEWLFLDQGCGYGANPWRAVRTAVIIMFLFSLIYAAGIGNFRIENPPLPDLPITNFFNRTLYALGTSVTVFTSGLSVNALQIAQGWMLVPLLIEALMGTLLWGLFIVSFSRKVIR